MENDEGKGITPVSPSDEIESCKYLSGAVCSKNGMNCVFVGVGCGVGFSEYGKTFCKLFSPKYKDKFALFAKDKSYLYEDVGSSGYWGGWNPEYKRVGYVEIQVSEEFYSEEEVRLLIRSWMKNVIVKKIGE